MVRKACQSRDCSGDPDGARTPKSVIAYSVSELIPHWSPPAPVSRRSIPASSIPGLQQEAAKGKSLREMAREMGVSYETIRSALRRG